MYPTNKDQPTITTREGEFLIPRKELMILCAAVRVIWSEFPHLREKKRWQSAFDIIEILEKKLGITLSEVQMEIIKNAD